MPIPDVPPLRNPNTHMDRQTRLWSLALAFLVVALCGSLSAWLWHCGVFNKSDTAILDATQAQFPERAPTDLDAWPVVYVKIGDISDEPWPWQSLDYAILTHSILRYFPRMVVFETPFYNTSDGPSVYDVQLNRQLSRLNHSIVGVPLTSTGRHTGTARNLRRLATHPENPELPAYGYGLWPIDPVAAAARPFAVALPTDTDGVLRRLPLLVNYQGVPTATSVLAAYAAWVGADLADSGVIMGRHILLKDSKGNQVATIPINHRGEILLRSYTETPVRREVEFFSVILAAENKQAAASPFDLGVFRNSIVLVGREHPNTTEAVRLPDGLQSPARVQLLGLANLIAGTHLCRPGTALMVALIMVAAVLGWGSTRLGGFLNSVLLFSLSIGLIFGATVLALTRHSMWLDPTALFAACAAAWWFSLTLTPFLLNNRITARSETIESDLF